MTMGSKHGGTSGQRQIYILLVEDEDNVRELFHDVLTSVGYAVDSSSTVAAALRLLRSRTYDLVIADDRLPDGRGLEIADKAKIKGIDAVVLTGYALHMGKDEIARYDLLWKPVRPRELVNEVARRIAAQPDPA
jgi:DNA-binding response OmpR family regulator